VGAARSALLYPSVVLTDEHTDPAYRRLIGSRAGRPNDAKADDKDVEMMDARLAFSGHHLRLVTQITYAKLAMQ
jgi:hypothetical protein